MSYSQISKERWYNITDRDKYEKNYNKIFNHKNISMFTKLLEFVNGKKTTIGTVLALIITFCLTKSYIDNDWALLLNGILVALGLTANIANAKMNQ